MAGAVKVLFLDYDGVLGPFQFEPDRSHLRPDERPQHAECCANIRRVIEATGCRLVISSAWRTDPAGLGFHDGVVEPLIRAGVIDDPSIVVGQTPQLLDLVRGDEIWAWLEEHPEVTRYAIVDDDPWAAARGEVGAVLLYGIEDETLSAHFVQMDAHVGCTQANADELIGLLTAPRSRPGAAPSGSER